MARAAHLFFKTAHGINGPVSAYRLQELVRRGMITVTTQVSPDGLKWLDAGRIRGLFTNTQAKGVVSRGENPIPIHGARPELKRIARAADGAVKRISRVFPVSVIAAVTLGLLACTPVFYFAARMVASRTSTVVLLFGAFLPAILLAAAAGQAAGNAILARMSGMTHADRRYLALHVPWSRAPGRWPGYFRNWIYGGDWLVDIQNEDIMPYVRVFVTGEVPASIDEEIGLWSQVLAYAPCRGRDGLETGHAVRELASVDRLPDWTREIAPGTSLPTLQKRLGRVGRDWAACLLQRARIRMPELAGADDRPEDALFEFHYLRLQNTREALLVIIRPRHGHHAPATVESSGFMEAAA